MMLGLDLSGARRMCWFISRNFVLSNGRGGHVERGGQCDDDGWLVGWLVAWCRCPWCQFQRQMK